VPNSGQDDRNADGAGDACQPSIEILDIRQDGGETLEVTVRLQDPNGDPVHGTIGFVSPPTTLDTLLSEMNCGRPLPPQSLPGRGIAFGVSEGVMFLVDADVGAAILLGSGCEDGVQDYELGDGSCSAGPPYFDYFIYLNDPRYPRTVC